MNENKFINVRGTGKNKPLERILSDLPDPDEGGMLTIRPNKSLKYSREIVGVINSIYSRNVQIALLKHFLSPDKYPTVYKSNFDTEFNIIKQYSDSLDNRDQRIVIIQAILNALEEIGAWTNEELSEIRTFINNRNSKV